MGLGIAAVVKVAIANALAGGGAIVGTATVDAAIGFSLNALASVANAITNADVLGGNPILARAAASALDVGSSVLVAAAAAGAGAASPTPLPAPAVAAALSLLASTTTVAGFGNATGSPATVTAVNTFIAALASAVSRGAPAGAQVDVSTLPLGATGPVCGPQVSLSVIRIAVGSVDPKKTGLFHISLARPLPFCGGKAAAAVGQATNAAGMSLPLDLIAQQPPPTVSIPYSVLAAMTAKVGPIAAGADVATVDFRLVQWSAAPMGERMGIGAVAYSPLADKSDAIAFSGLSRRLDLDTGLLSLSRRASLVGDFYAAVNSVMGGANANAAASDAAKNSARDQLRAAAPPPTSAVDLIPSRTLDSRVFSVSASAGDAPPAPLASLKQATKAYRITVPLRDLTIVKYKEGGGVTGVDIGQDSAAFASPLWNVTCPLDGVRPGIAGGGLTIPALNVAALPPAIGTAMVVSAQSVLYVGLAVSAAMPGDATSSEGLNSLVGGPSAGRYDAISTGISNATIGAWSVVLSVNCGAAFGAKSFVCGPSTGGQSIQYACPKAVPTAACLYYDAKSVAWTTEGCEVAEVGITSVVCACDRLADFGTRYAALPQARAGVYAASSPVAMTTKLPSAAILFAAVALLLAALACNGGGGVAKLRRERAVAYGHALSKDGEIALARALAGGAALPIDRDVGKGGGGGGKVGGKVVPSSLSTCGGEEVIGGFSIPPPAALALLLNSQRTSSPAIPAPLLKALLREGLTDPQRVEIYTAVRKALRAKSLWDEAASAIRVPSKPPALFTTVSATLSSPTAPPHPVHARCGRRSVARFASNDYASADGGLRFAFSFHVSLVTLGFGAVFYAWALSPPGAVVVIPTLSGPAAAALAATIATIAACYAIALYALTSAGARAYSAWRWPGAAGEVARRAAFGRALLWSTAAIIDDDPTATGSADAAPSLTNALARLDAAIVRVPHTRSLGDSVTASPAARAALVAWLIHGRRAMEYDPFTVLASSPATAASPAAALALVETFVTERSANAKPPIVSIVAVYLPWIASLWAALYCVAFGLRQGGNAANSLVGAWVFAEFLRAASRPVWDLAVEVVERGSGGVGRGAALGALEYWSLPTAAASVGGTGNAASALNAASILAVSAFVTPTAETTFLLAAPHLFLLVSVERAIENIERTQPQPPLTMGEDLLVASLKGGEEERAQESESDFSRPTTALSIASARTADPNDVPPMPLPLRALSMAQTDGTYDPLLPLARLLVPAFSVRDDDARSAAARAVTTTSLPPKKGLAAVIEIEMLSNPSSMTARRTGLGLMTLGGVGAGASSSLASGGPASAFALSKSPIFVSPRPIPPITRAVRPRGAAVFPLAAAGKAILAAPRRILPSPRFPGGLPVALPAPPRFLLGAGVLGRPNPNPNLERPMGLNLFPPRGVAPTPARGLGYQ